MFFFAKKASAIALSLLIAVTALGLLPSSPAYAAGPSISIETELGFGDLTKLDEWSPLTVKLTSDKDVSGELVVQTELPDSGTRVSHVQRIDLPAGTTKSVTFGVVGNAFNKRNSEIRFYQGTAETGKYIPFSSGLSYLQNVVSNGTVIGALSEDPDTANFLAAMNGTGFNTRIVPLQKEQIPDEGILLSGLDVLMLNNFASDALSSKQLEAIRSWVHRGGTLVLSGGQGYAKTAQGFEDLSPVEYKGSMDATEGTFAEFAKAGGKALSISDPFPLSESVLKDGAEADVSAGSLPLLASWEVGKGKVRYAAYDLAMEPLHSWAGHAEVWKTVLGEELSANNAVMRGVNSQRNSLSGVSYLLDYFPSLSLPPFSLLLWLLIGYALLVAPALYYVLKKFDKREWAWGLIPLIAVIASAGIYMAGTAGKSSVRAHTLSMVELDGKGLAVSSSATALFVPRGGTYSVQLPKGTYVTMQREDGLLSGGQTGGADRQLIRQNEESTDVKLREMTHRSIAKLWMDNSASLTTGALDIRVSYDSNGKPQGTVTNGTDTDLQNAALFTAGQVYVLGDLPKGEQVSIPASSSSLAYNYNDYGMAVFPTVGNMKENNLLERQRGMINQFMNQTATANKHVVIAWNEEKLGGLKVNGKEAASDWLNMVVQAYEPDLTGEAGIPYGLIDPVISAATAKEWYNNGMQAIDMSPGDLTLEYSLPKGAKNVYAELGLRWTNRGQNTSLMIWNTEKKAWDEAEAGVNSQTGTALDANSYIEGNKVKLKITAAEWASFNLPEISLKGGAAK